MIAEVSHHMGDVRFGIVWDGKPAVPKISPAWPFPHFSAALRVLHGLSPLFLFATFKSLMTNTHDIDDLLTTGAPIHTINEHLADGHHIITYKALTCKYQGASQAGSSRSVCAAIALNCIRLAFQLEAGKGVKETILRSFFSEKMMNVSTLFSCSYRGNLTILTLASNGHS